MFGIEERDKGVTYFDRAVKLAIAACMNGTNGGEECESRCDAYRDGEDVPQSLVFAARLYAAACYRSGDKVCASRITVLRTLCLERQFGVACGELAAVDAPQLRLGYLIAACELGAQRTCSKIATAMPARPMNVVVTRTAFKLLVPSMRLSTVEAIADREGELVSEVVVPGTVPTSIYRWTNADGSNMVVTFQGGRLVGKQQFGLE